MTGVRLSVEGLAIRRGERLLMRELSFAAAPGDFIELRGPNGSGKTSLLRALAGFLRPEEGAIRIEGVEEPALALHFVGHRDGLKPTLSARAHARYWADLLGAGGDFDQALERLGLAAIADLPARALSQGQGRRLALTRLMLARRPIWLLDEPAAALDTGGKALLEELIAAHRAGDGIVIAALHEPLSATATQVIAL